MYLNKYPYPANFEYLSSYKPGRQTRIGRTSLCLQISRFAGDVYRIECKGPAWKKDHILSPLTPPRPADGGMTRLSTPVRFGLKLADAAGNTLLNSPEGMTFGLCGPAWIFRFNREPGDLFYGMGEKTFDLELSGKRTKFWNTDAWFDFPGEVIQGPRYDPAYLSIPYLIIRRGNAYIGMLLDNPFAAFIHTDAPQQPPAPGSRKLASSASFCLGSTEGRPILYLIYGPSLGELTRKLQRLVGCTPMPPAWALGYHQCRWGYKSDKDLYDLDRNFSKHRIPCDGLWLDIEYMDGYRVFTFDKGNFPNPEKTFKRLAKNGRRVVPILDPGVKRERGYSVYDSGKKADAYCCNPQGREFVGLVWPGDTVFPDFSSRKTRDWWAAHTRDFADRGVAGAWLDMNDPATGAVDCHDMLFDKGKTRHTAYHNQYALGMQMASRDGFLRARPDERPFLISRSGSTGTSRFTGIWTGDNMSTYAHLKKSIPVSLNLALSGVPMNAPDIGGFGGDTTPQLISDWMKACFLFPFCRNHTSCGTRQQEPWAFDRKTLQILRHYIQLRYRLRPYLYNLFAQQEMTGEPILRPLLLDFNDTAKLPLAKVQDQFMVGPWIMQAPVLEEKTRSREVILPGKHAWWSAIDAHWCAGNRKVFVKPAAAQTPLYIREGALIPMATTPADDNAYDGRKVECHIFLRRNGIRSGAMEYIFDDGLTFDYRKGKRSNVLISATVRGSTLELSTKHTKTGFGEADISFVLYDSFASVTLNGKPVRQIRHSWSMAGTTHKAWQVSQADSGYPDAAGSHRTQKANTR